MATILKQSEITDSENISRLILGIGGKKEHFRINTETIFLPASDWYL
jgi:hypothetical protein